MDSTHQNTTILDVLEELFKVLNSDTTTSRQIRSQLIELNIKSCSVSTVLILVYFTRFYL